MNPETTQAAPPRVGAVIAVDESGNRPNFVARCACGWNAVTSATEPTAAETELRALVDAHRRVCPLRSAES